MNEHRFSKAPRVNENEGRSSLRLIVQGRVQGVGFRPFVYRLAKELELAGHVRNTPRGVEIDLHGPGEALERFQASLREKGPSLARITNIHTEGLPFDDQLHAFAIVRSEPGAEHSVLISPDIALCQACRREVLDPFDRRFAYPFTNCTDCGPRLTITENIPYDRRQTSMDCFPMCAACRQEYEDPLDRRFHAQPNACPDCGPQLWYAETSGHAPAHGPSGLDSAARALLRGDILAVKGLGGFHLACAADDESTISRLRQVKKRPHKALAVMAPDLCAARDIASLRPEDEAWLQGAIQPIVLVAKKSGALPEILAPDTTLLGLMLPYTPLHVLLLLRYRQLSAGRRPPVLVMTSGNRAAEPICLGNREALAALSGVADGFLLHNRDILVRCDDSVLRPRKHPDPPLIFRRARGLTPNPVFIGRAGPPALGLGPEAKATLCFLKGREAYVSQHIGDLTNVETFAFYRELLAHFEKLLRITPHIVAADLHPDYMSTRLAAEYTDRPVVFVQHHLAHILAVLAENRSEEPALGIALDGTGLGEDGTLWGGELLLVDPGKGSFSRLAHLAPVGLPGGSQAIEEPWRMALSYLQAIGADCSGAAEAAIASIPERSRSLVAQMLAKGWNCPATTSCGRLFDAVSSLLGLCDTASYEGQAAVRLEAVQEMGESRPYPCPVDASSDPAVLDSLTLFASAFRDRQQGIAPGIISRRFHLGLARGLAGLAQAFSRRTGLDRVALSGGVLQNRTLAQELSLRLEQLGLTPLVHLELPPNDACISLGQALYARVQAS
jgi:hydrogenase maturation protein HypF